MNVPRDIIPRCSATKHDGCLCMVIISPTTFRCVTHSKVLTRKGSRQFVYDEVRFRSKRMLDHWRNMHIIDLVELIHPLYDQIIAWCRIAKATFRNMTDDAITDLLNQRGSWYIRNHPEPISEYGVVYIPPIQRQVQTTDLVKFVSDKQNIHLTVTVNQTTEIVKRVLKIPVPEEYRWNTQTLSKTPGDIISSCKLTPNAGAVMTDKYSRDDDVYELGNGIYGKVLDAVWQYISNSEDKVSLCAILRQELQDNIGMCAQGNLSRLCNALAGYMEGIHDTESPSEKLGRLLPALMEIADVTERIEKVKKLLADVELPKEEWENWLSACYE